MVTCSVLGRAGGVFILCCWRREWLEAEERGGGTEEQPHEESMWAAKNKWTADGPWMVSPIGHAQSMS